VYVTIKDNTGKNTTGLLAGCSYGVVLMKRVSVYSEAIIRFTNVSYTRLITMRGTWQMLRGGVLSVPSVPSNVQIFSYMLYKA